ncbi:molybdopterin dinucleotide binding domain-containing protein [Bradyrhizobium sp. RDM4]|uniref:molybdopterin dinucleotide binding domain-containing protein n=1 Tax=Bradyrhizobium sp. RDM4 TaxID=3378765 RepID=UPI0038FC1D5B
MLKKVGIALPKYAQFRQGPPLYLADRIPDASFINERFYADPERNRLGTPSGKIEIFSEKVASFGYDDCLGHAAWFDKREWLGGPRAEQFPLHLLSNQPSTRLHSQLDNGVTSRQSKIRGREPMRLHPQDAAARGIRDGDVVRVFNDRGAFLAGVKLSDELRPGVAQIATGAWYDIFDPEDPMSLEVHGNPNAVTCDRGTSSLAQGPSSNSCLVEVERFDAALPPISVFSPPSLVHRDQPISPAARRSRRQQ